MKVSDSGIGISDKEKLEIFKKFYRVGNENTRNTNQRNPEYFDDYIVDTNLGKKANRWFSEKVMGENPYLIRENSISTTAVQDLSERNMGSGYGSPSSK